MGTKRTHIVFPSELVTEMDRLIGKRQRTRFVTDIVWNEIKRLRLLRAIQQAKGAWKDNDHPELKRGAAQFIRKLRRESDQRLRRLAE